MTKDSKNNFKNDRHLEHRKVVNISLAILQRTHLSTHSLSLRTINLLDQPEEERKANSTRRTPQKEKTSAPEEIESVSGTGTEDAWGASAFLRALALQAALPFFPGGPFPSSSQDFSLSEPESEGKKGRPLLEKDKGNILNATHFGDSKLPTPETKANPLTHPLKHSISPSSPIARSVPSKPEIPSSSLQPVALKPSQPFEMPSKPLPSSTIFTKTSVPASSAPLPKEEGIAPLSGSHTKSVLSSTDPFPSTVAAQTQKVSLKTQSEIEPHRAPLKGSDRVQTLRALAETVSESAPPISPIKSLDLSKRMVENGTQNLRSILPLATVPSAPATTLEAKHDRFVERLPASIQPRAEAASLERQNLDAPSPGINQEGRTVLNKPQRTLAKEHHPVSLEKEKNPISQQPLRKGAVVNQTPQLSTSFSSFPSRASLSHPQASLSANHPFSSPVRPDGSNPQFGARGSKQIPIAKRTVLKMSAPSNLANIPRLPASDAPAPLQPQKEEEPEISVAEQEPEFVAKLYEKPVLIENYFAVPQL